MDHSTDGVTLYAGFILDILGEYESMRPLSDPAFALARDVLGKRPDEPVPMQTYNDICDWIEQTMGPASIRAAGRAIGARVHTQMLASGGIAEGATPVAVLKALQRAAEIMIQDPKGRGWELLEVEERRAVMRRTQTFNCVLQEGLLPALVERTPVVSVRVDHVACVRNGDDYCDYAIQWLPRLRG